MALLIQQILNGLIIGSTYAVVAVGFSLVFTVLRVINFAHPDVFMLGMFASLAAAHFVSGNPVVVLVAGAAGAALFGLVLERVVIRPLRHRDVLMTLIATLGVAIMMENGMALIEGPDPLPFPGLLAQTSFSAGGVAIGSRQIANFVVSLFVLGFGSWYVRATRFGRATRAIAERPDVAAAFGVNVDVISRVTVVLSSAMAGLAAVSVAALYGSAWVFVGTLYGLKAFIVMLVAGNRHFEGVVVVAFGLGVLEALVTGYVSSSLADAVAFFLLIGVLYFRPNGLFGSYAI